MYELLQKENLNTHDLLGQIKSGVGRRLLPVTNLKNLLLSSKNRRTDLNQKKESIDDREKLMLWG